jgi:hypothetical protein
MKRTQSKNEKQSKDLLDEIGNVYAYSTEDLNNYFNKMKDLSFKEGVESVLKDLTSIECINAFSNEYTSMHDISKWLRKRLRKARQNK